MTLTGTITDVRTRRADEIFKVARNPDQEMLHISIISTGKTGRQAMANVRSPDDHSHLGMFIKKYGKAPTPGMTVDIIFENGYPKIVYPAPIKYQKEA